MLTIDIFISAFFYNFIIFILTRISINHRHKPTYLKLHPNVNNARLMKTQRILIAISTEPLQIS
jgi:hypothetical protein